MGIKEVFVYLENLGLLNVVVPFVIIFIVLYALLNRVKLFKDNRVNVVLSTLVSFIAIAAADIVRNVNLFSYYLVILVFVFIAVLMLIGLLGGKLDLMSGKKKTYFTWTVAVIMCLLIIYALYLSGVQIDLGPISYDFLRSVIPIAIAVLVFVLIVWFVSSGDKKTRTEERAAARTEERQKDKTRLPIISDINKKADQLLKSASRRSASAGEPQITQEQIDQLEGKTTEEKIRLLKQWGFELPV